MLLAIIYGKLFPLVLRPLPAWKYVEYKLLQLLGLPFVPPPPACRIRTVRAVIWMCSPVRIHLCVRLLRSSVQIKLLRYPQRPILEMLQGCAEVMAWAAHAITSTQPETYPRDLSFSLGENL